MVALFNELLSCYKLYIDWFFSYTIDGIPVGYLFLACIIFGLVGYYFLGRMK